MRTEALRGLLEAARGAERRMVERLRALVEVESPSQDKGAVDRASAMVAGWCGEMGAEVVWHRFAEVGDSMEARFAGEGCEGRPVLLLGHVDTVWDVGTLRTMPWREEGGRIFGPGVLDMKAGVVMAVTAIELLRELRLRRPPVVLLLHGDEEIGSPGSRAVTERVAAGCGWVYVLEPAQGAAGAYKTARKGVGQYRLEVTGVAAHAGVDFASGHSAVMELARQLLQLAEMSDAERGVTLNAGVIRGGTRPNVVAAEAWAEVDVRVVSAENVARVEREFAALRAVDPACRVTVSGGINRPPMVRSEAIAGLFRRAREMAEAMGVGPLEEAATGGGSDGNFTAAMGVPTLDGMGAVGVGAHAVHEHIERRFLVERTALLSAMLLADEGGVP